MRILSISAQKPVGTGSGTYMMSLVRGFDKLGHEQAVIAGIDAGDDILTDNRIMFYPVIYNTSKMPFHVPGMSDVMPYKSTRYSQMDEEKTNLMKEAFTEVFLRAVNEFSPDLIICHHLYYVTSLAVSLLEERKKKGIRVFAVCHSTCLRQLSKHDWQKDFITKMICRLDGVFSLQEAQKKEICERFRIDERRVFCVGAGYDSDHFRILPGVRKESEILRLLYVGKMTVKKGVHSLVRCLNSYIPKSERKKIRLELVGGHGDEDEFEMIMNEIKRGDCEINYLGWLSDEELLTEMNSHDMLVLPSFYEGLALVVIEAMACGMKVVCTDLPGIKDWIYGQITGNPVVFVKPPRMINSDSPIEKDLPEFERSFAEAILKADELQEPNGEEVKKLGWSGVCERIIDISKD